MGDDDIDTGSLTELGLMTTFMVNYVFQRLISDMDEEKMVMMASLLIYEAHRLFWTTRQEDPRDFMVEIVRKLPGVQPELFLPDTIN